MSAPVRTVQIGLEKEGQGEQRTLHGECVGREREKREHEHRVHTDTRTDAEAHRHRRTNIDTDRRCLTRVVGAERKPGVSPRRTDPPGTIVLSVITARLVPTSRKATAEQGTIMSESYGRTRPGTDQYQTWPANPCYTTPHCPSSSDTVMHVSDADAKASANSVSLAKAQTTPGVIGQGAHPLSSGRVGFMSPMKTTGAPPASFSSVKNASSSCSFRTEWLSSPPAEAGAVSIEHKKSMTQQQS